jgi:hypothetical protein
MGRLNAAERTAALFEVTDEDIQKCVGAFILELSTHSRSIWDKHG